MGIPTVGIVRVDFIPVLKNAIAGLGFPPEMAMVPVPMALFLPGSDLTPVAQNLDQVVAGLTRWQPQVTVKSMIKPRRSAWRGRPMMRRLRRPTSCFSRTSGETACR